MRIDFSLRPRLFYNRQPNSCHSGPRLQCAIIATTQNVTKLTKNGQTPFAPAFSIVGRALFSLATPFPLIIKQFLWVGSTFSELAGMVLFLLYCNNMKKTK
jgi:hypothetical protein